jgi:hypothetical protein
MISYEFRVSSVSRELWVYRITSGPKAIRKKLKLRSNVYQGSTGCTTKKNLRKRIVWSQGSLTEKVDRAEKQK